MAERVREKAGWATKQGGTIVRKRWFVLKDQHLHYYKTPTVRAQPTPTPGRMGPRGPPGKQRAQFADVGGVRKGWPRHCLQPLTAPFLQDASAAGSISLRGCAATADVDSRTVQARAAYRTR